ncbi:MAG: arylsulfotransferase family protein [Solirubrobacteraceae bacterium]
MLSVSGSATGAHSGRLLAYSQGDGGSFLPSRSFLPGERVTVRAMVRSGRSEEPLLDVFRIATPDPLSSTPERTHPGTSTEEQVFRSRPDVRPPAVKLISSSPAAAQGDIFTAPYGGPGRAGPMILDPSGGLLWFKALPQNTVATNLRLQEYLGRPVLTWWQGSISVHGFGMGEGVIANSRYEDIGHIRAGNGLHEDLHELQLTPSGTALVTAYFPILCNLAGLGGRGNPYSGLTDGVMQEIDVRTGLVMYEWSSLDHVALTDSYSQVRYLEASASPYDFFHINSINLDRDGSLLISARNTWTVYDVDPATGRVRWRLGGKRSSFKLGSLVGTAWQHDARELADGSFSIFDNGSSPRIHQQSRGVVVGLDPRTGSATLREQLLHAPGLTAESEGDVQALPGGDWFVGWGQEPFFSELSADGKRQLFDARFAGRTRSYRSFRFPWVGTPAHPPVYAFAASGKRGGTVYASWNGATQVSSWRVLVGGSPATMRPLPSVPRAGFETAVALPAGTVGPVLAVQALGAEGGVLGSSAPSAQSALR